MYFGKFDLYEFGSFIHHLKILLSIGIGIFAINNFFFFTVINNWWYYNLYCL